MESQKEQALHPLLLPLCVLVCGGAMIGVFRLLGKLDDSVLYGAALGCGVCILNLFLLILISTQLLLTTLLTQNDILIIFHFIIVYLPTSNFDGTSGYIV